jgi:hypothetical protein
LARNIFLPPSLWAITTANWRSTPIHMLQTLAHYGGRNRIYCTPNIGSRS